MTSQARIEANRQNAQKSTGPKTPEGNQIASQNSAAHGLFSKTALTRRENAAEFETYRAAMLQDLAPVGQYETALAERIVVLMWHLARSVRFQTESLDSLILKPEPPKKISLPFNFDPSNMCDCNRIGISDDEFDQIADNGGYEAVAVRAKELVKERQLEEDKLAEARAAELDNSFGGICVRDFSNARVIERLSLLEQRLQKQLFTAQRQLDRLQQKRRELIGESPAHYIVDKLQEKS